MGEHKLPKPVLRRPDAAILGMRMAVSTSKTEAMDPDTRDFMADLTRIMAWIDHLEAKNPPPPVLDA